MKWLEKLTDGLNEYQVGLVMECRNGGVPLSFTRLHPEGVSGKMRDYTIDTYLRTRRHIIPDSLHSLKERGEKLNYSYSRFLADYKQNISWWHKSHPDYSRMGKREIYNARLKILARKRRTISSDTRIVGVKKSNGKHKTIISRRKGLIDQLQLYK